MLGRLFVISGCNPEMLVNRRQDYQTLVARYGVDLRLVLNLEFALGGHPLPPESVESIMADALRGAPLVVASTASGMLSNEERTRWLRGVGVPEECILPPGLSEVKGYRIYLGGRFESGEEVMQQAVTKHANIAVSKQPFPRMADGDIPVMAGASDTGFEGVLWVGPVVSGPREVSGFRSGGRPSNVRFLRLGPQERIQGVYALMSEPGWLSI